MMATVKCEQKSVKQFKQVVKMEKNDSFKTPTIYWPSFLMFHTLSPWAQRLFGRPAAILFSNVANMNMNLTTTSLSCGKQRRKLKWRRESGKGKAFCTRLSFTLNFISVLVPPCTQRRWRPLPPAASDFDGCVSPSSFSSDSNFPPCISSSCAGCITLGGEYDIVAGNSKNTLRNNWCIHPGDFCRKKFFPSVTFLWRCTIAAAPARCIIMMMRSSPWCWKMGQEILKHSLLFVHLSTESNDPSKKSPYMHGETKDCGLWCAWQCNAKHA